MKTPAELAERKAAKAAYNAAWRAAHPDYFANWNEANRERKAARAKARRQDHLDEYKIREAAARKAHPEKYAKWAKKNHEHVVAYKAAWCKAHPEKLRAATVRARKRHPVENRARGILCDAIRDGKMKRGVCVVCGASRTHGHHHDYSKPLDVIWLCAKDHKRVHRGELVVDTTTAKFTGPVAGLAVTVEPWQLEGDR